MFYMDKINNKKKITKLFGLKILLFSIRHHLVKLSPWNQNIPTLGVTKSIASFQIRTKKLEENSGDRFRDTWPSCLLSELL